MSGLALAQSGGTILKLVGMNGSTLNKSYDVYYKVYTENFTLFTFQ